MELRSGQEAAGIHMVFNSTTLSDQQIQKPNEGGSSSSKLLQSDTNRRRSNHGGTVLNPPQTLDHHHHHPPHLLHPHSNNLPHQTPHGLLLQPRNSNPDPSPPASNIAPVITSSITSNSKPPSPPSQPQPQPSSSASASFQYKECLKNHAASTGGHVVDGCGEFMPRGEENTPESLRCAACDCHRNFHRREENTAAAATQIQSGNNNTHSNYPYHHLPPPPPALAHNNTSRYSSHRPIPPPMMMAFHSGGAPAESSSEDLNMFHYNYNNDGGAAGAATAVQAAGKKRYRTKFSQGQKERMQEFAERLEWKMQKQDDQLVDQFCAEVGVKRQVFKVWMHNNKATIKKKQH